MGISKKPLTRSDTGDKYIIIDGVKCSLGTKCHRQYESIRISS
ncbi:MAG: hypothetical protein ACD_79C01515G0007, partial [uncultured bacterium]